MSRGRTFFGVFVAIALAAAGVQAGDVSRQQADSFAKKVAIITQRGVTPTPRPAQARTIVSETEVNSWFTYRAQEHIPKGVTQPQVTIIGNGKVAGQAVVDLEAVGKKRSSGGLLDPWSYLGGRVPVNVVGILHTKDGVGKFELESADVSGVPVPAGLLQELLSYYSRTNEKPQGIRLDRQFTLPANIRQIEVGQGRAVVVQ